MLVSLLPLTANLQNVRGSGVLQPIWEDLDQEALAPSSRCQKADGASWVDLWIPKPSSFTNWKDGLGPAAGLGSFQVNV